MADCKFAPGVMSFILGMTTPGEYREMLLTSTHTYDQHNASNTRPFSVVVHNTNYILQYFLQKLPQGQTASWDVGGHEDIMKIKNKYFNIIACKL